MSNGLHAQSGTRKITQVVSPVSWTILCRSNSYFVLLMSQGVSPFSHLWIGFVGATKSKEMLPGRVVSHEGERLRIKNSSGRICARTLDP